MPAYMHTQRENGEAFGDVPLCCAVRRNFGDIAAVGALGVTGDIAAVGALGMTAVTGEKLGDHA